MRSNGLVCWSAACSTGEEPDTLAMLLEEHRARDIGFTYSVFASDLSTQALELAAAAVYSVEQAVPIPRSYKKKYLLRSRDRESGLVRMRAELRAKVRFGCINFMDQRSMSEKPSMWLSAAMSSSISSGRSRKPSSGGPWGTSGPADAFTSGIPRPSRE